MDVMQYIRDMLDVAQTLTPVDIALQLISWNIFWRI
jgi:hypothetical protein